MAQLFSLINNAAAAKHKIVYCPYKTQYLQILTWLEKKGFIYSYKIVKTESNLNQYQIKLKYYKNKPLGILTVINKPSNYSYYTAKNYKTKLNLQKSNLCISSSVGLLTKSSSLTRNQGGTPLFYINLLGKNLDS